MDKTILFFGAGFTTALGFPTTDMQKELFSLYFFDGNEFRKRYSKTFGYSTTEELINAQSKEKSSFSTRYLCQYIKYYFTADSFSIQNMYNLLFSQINTGMTYGNRSNLFSHEALLEIRYEMVALLQYIFSEYTKIALNKPELQRYIDFFTQNAKKVIDNRIAMATREMDLASTEFVIAPLSYISLNWDVLFIWAMFNAHKALNDSNIGYVIHNGKNLKLKIFNDFSTYMATKSIDNKKGGKWFPYNEPVATHINDEDHLHDKCVTLIKTYLPHGQTNWLECPQCGKLSMYLGNTWAKKSPTLAMRNPGEEKYECLHCNYELTTQNSSMLIQTIYKNKSSYIQEIQTDMHLQISKADKVVFIGYSLPEDDIDYRALFTTLISQSNGSFPEIYVVLFDNNFQNTQWYCYDQAVSKVNSNNKQIMERYINIFDKSTVRFTFCGFPNASEMVTALI